MKLSLIATVLGAVSVNALELKTTCFIREKTANAALKLYSA